MKYDPERHHRRSVRLQGYDYTQNGAYFVTICVHNRECLFGDIGDDGVMQLSQCGEIVYEEWVQTAVIRREVDLDAFVVMPNHVHAIILLMGKDEGVNQVGVQNVGANRRFALQTTIAHAVRHRVQLVQLCSSLSPLLPNESMYCGICRAHLYGSEVILTELFGMKNL